MGQFDRKAQSQRKHGPLSDSGASKAPGPVPINRPGWKGPGHVKKRPPQPSQPLPLGPPRPEVQEQLLPVELQQLLLNIFRDAFPSSRDPDALKPTLRSINDALLLRDFKTAFATEEHRESYALRWSPIRVLAFSNLLAEICSGKGEHQWWADSLMHQPEVNEISTEHARNPTKAVCFGGGAAGLAAFAGLLRHVCPDAAGRSHVQSPSLSENIVDKQFAPSPSSLDSSVESAPLLELCMIDMADWSSVISKLQLGLETPPVLSKYASAAACASNFSFLSPGSLKPTFTQANILTFSIQDLRSMIGPYPLLITLFFTLNDLYSDSIPNTTAFLMKLTMVAPEDSLLLVVDSPGSRVEFTASDLQSTKSIEIITYTVERLMSRTLVGKAGADGEEPEAEPKWKKIATADNRHNKLDGRLRYPLSLENTSFQMHLFRRL